MKTDIDYTAIQKAHGIGEVRKPILCIDFDGVLHSYNSGWKGAGIVSDPPVPGAVAFLYAAQRHFDLAIFSSRSNQPGGIDAMRGALTMWIMAELGDEAAEAHRLIEALQFPLEKPPAHLSIYDRALRFDDRALCFDDRALHFNGSWPSPGLLLAFKPWNKREPQPETPVIDNKPELSACCAAIDALLDTALERARGCREPLIAGAIQNAKGSLDRLRAEILPSTPPQNG